MIPQVPIAGMSPGIVCFHSSKSGLEYDKQTGFVETLKLQYIPGQRMISPVATSSSANTVILHTYSPVKTEQSAPKRWHVNYRRQ
jgi:hypothetical protein